MALAPISDASSRMIANSRPTVPPRWCARPDATAPASVKLPTSVVPANPNAVTAISAVAPAMTTTIPMTKSARAYGIQRAVMRLSTTLDCWKNSCQGATVVPTIATISSSTVESSPPGNWGTIPLAVCVRVGCTSSTIGMISTFTAISTNISASQRRNEPPATTANNSTVAAGIAMILGQPKKLRAIATPMNSVTMVKALRISRSPTLKAPQNLPKRSNINRACPNPGDGAQPKHHFLVDVQHRNQQHQRPQQVHPVVLPGLCVGRDTAGVVVAHHHDQSRAGDDHQCA